METLPKNPLLEFNPDTLVSVRKLYNFDNAARMNEAIDIFEEWIKKQDHFVKKSFPREYLERVIIFSKGSVERAKTKLDKLCSQRSMYPKFFEMFDEDKINLPTALMPKLTPDHYRVYMINNCIKYDSNYKGYMDNYKFSLYMLQYMLRYDYCDGIVAIIDYRSTDILEGMKYVNIVELKQYITILTEGLGMRIIGIHMLTSSKAVDVVVSLFKKMMSEKVGGRIHIHTSIESLHEYVPKEILPEEYGGNEKPLAQIEEHFVDTFKSEDSIEYMNEMNKAQTKEEYRQKDDLCNDSLPGTFMSLNID